MHHRYYKNKYQGFTLIEMLIVVVIIGILSVALIPRIQSVQGRTRDIKRKVDLQQMKTAITLYFNDMGVYPVAKNSVWPSGQPYVFSRQSATPWLDGLGSYMSKIPVDPLNVAPYRNSGDTYAGAFYEGNYVYTYGNRCEPSLGGCGFKNYYNLWAQLENKQDPVTNGNIKYYTFSVNNYTLQGYADGLYSINPEQITPR